MLTSPITVTIDGVAHSLSRVNQDNFGSVYLKKAAQLEIRMHVRHAYEKATPAGQYERHNVDLQYTTFDNEGKPSTTQVYTVLRTIRGKAVKEVVDVSAGLNDFVDTNASSIAAWES